MGWYWAQDQETCTDACINAGLLCDTGESRAVAEGIGSQTTQTSLEARMTEANANSGDVFTWPGTCNSWVSQQWSPLPFFQTGNSKCYSSGLNPGGNYG